MKIIKVNAYSYTELSDESKHRAIVWLDECPLDYDEGIEYFSDMLDEDVGEHCDINEYCFDSFGDPIHHLETKELK